MTDGCETTLDTILRYVRHEPALRNRDALIDEAADWMDAHRLDHNDLAVVLASGVTRLIDRLLVPAHALRLAEQFPCEKLALEKLAVTDSVRILRALRTLRPDDMAYALPRLLVRATEVASPVLVEELSQPAGPGHNGNLLVRALPDLLRDPCNSCALDHGRKAVAPVLARILRSMPADAVETSLRQVAMRKAFSDRQIRTLLVFAALGWTDAETADSVSKPANSGRVAAAIKIRNVMTSSAHNRLRLHASGLMDLEALLAMPMPHILLRVHRDFR